MTRPTHATYTRLKAERDYARRKLRELREAAEAYKAAHYGSATQADEAAQKLWELCAACE